ncbi:prepilin-type N-terminal cleavage/methylation domain-containing protein [Rubripirellula obstinata]|nr:prepilin-type N-terminal cleavage/methylation domain-containing protein [Rubripirellula obstinata]
MNNASKHSWNGERFLALRLARPLTRRGSLIGVREGTRKRVAFTLVEIMVVFVVLSILAAIALPVAKNMIADQHATRTARGISSYIDRIRNRAIAEGRPMGVLIERLANTDSDFGRAHSVRIRTMSGMPPYSGDSSNSTVQLQTNGINAQFEPSDNQLLTLSASMVADPAITDDVDDLRAPIRNGDFIELPGGRLVPFVITHRALTEPDTTKVVITFDLQQTVGGSQTFPSASMSFMAAVRSVPYKIHRRPAVSSAAPFDLPKGMAIDLNYSGLGSSGNQFAPSIVDLTVPVFNIAVVFGSDGKVISASQTSDGIGPPPIGQLFFCIGETDGVRADDLWANERRSTANILNTDSIWLVINPSTGRVVTSPFSDVSQTPPTDVADPTTAELSNAIAQARQLALLSDTVDLE